MAAAARRSARSVRMAGAAAGLAGVAASAVLVWHASYSAFSATTSNPTSNWAAGTVVLADDDSNTAMFAVGDLAPSSTGTKCVTVSSTGSLPATVKLYGTGYSDTKALAESLNLTITQGSGSCAAFSPLASGANVYTGTLAGFAATATGYATGLGNWATTGTGTETRVYQFNYTLDPAAPNSTQGGSAALGFTWEAQNR